MLCCAALRLRCAALRCACACACVCAVPALRLRESEESWYGSLQPATTTARWGASRLTTSTRPLGCAVNAIFCALILDPSQSVSHHRHTAHTAPPSMLTCLRAGAQRAWRSGVCLLVQVRCAANCLSWLLHCFLWFLVVASWGVCTSSGGDLAATARRCPLGATACLTPPPIPAPNPSPLSCRSLILLEIQDTLRQPPSTVKTMKRAVNIAVTGAFVFYFTVAVAGYVSLGNGGQCGSCRAARCVVTGQVD